MTFILPFRHPDCTDKYPICHNSCHRAIKSALVDGKPILRCLRKKEQRDTHYSAPDRDACPAVSHAASRHRSSDQSEVRSGLRQRLCNSIRWSQTLEANKTILVGPTLAQSPPPHHYFSIPLFTGNGETDWTTHIPRKHNYLWPNVVCGD